jgi:sugar phosphate isomerase/epimerase
MIESFAGLCDDAAAAGIGVTLELFPVSNVRDLATGRAIVEGAARPNGGLLLDIWHMVRGGVAFADIAALPPGTITHVELDDAAATCEGSIMDDTIDRRLLCGEGSFDIGGFLRSVAATGYDGAYGVEILSEVHRARTPEDAARLSFETTRRCFDPLPA